MSKKVKNEEKGHTYSAEKGQNWWKMRKIIFCGFFSEKNRKMSKKVKNDENGSYIAEKGQIDEKRKKLYFLDFFQ